MGAALLRPERCLNCGGSMPERGRIDRRYCKPSCRTLAYRHRRRTSTPAIQRPRVPQWVEGQPPVIMSALAALADLQMRVLHLAHHLEQDDIAYRHPCVGLVADEPPAAAPSPHREALAERIQQLEAALEQARSETVDARQRADATQQYIDAFDGELREAQASAADAKEHAEAAQRSIEKLGNELRAVRDEVADRQAQLDTVRAKLAQAEKRETESRAQQRTEREDAQQRYDAQTQKLDEARGAEASLRQELGRLQGEAKELQRSVRRATTLEEQLRDAAAREGELIAQLVTMEAQVETAKREADELATELEKAQKTAKRVAELRQTNMAQRQDLAEAQKTATDLRGEVQRLRPPPAEVDPLNQLMKEKVRALVRLTQYQAQTQVPLVPFKPQLTQFYLSRNDEPTVFAAAIEMATEMRRDFFYRKRFSGEPAPTWLHQDRQLDPASEQTLHAKLEKEVSDLQRHLRRAKLIVGD